MSCNTLAHPFHHSTRQRAHFTRYTSITTSATGGCIAGSIEPCKLVSYPISSVDGTGCGKSHLATVLWCGACGISRRFWGTREAAQSPRITRLVSHRLSRIRLGQQASGPPNRDQRDIPTIRFGNKRGSGIRSAKHLAVSSTSLSTAGTRHPGSSLIPIRAPGGKAGRSVRETLSTTWALGGLQFWQD